METLLRHYNTKIQVKLQMKKKSKLFLFSFLFAIEYIITFCFYNLYVSFRR